jgi:hypothetical protein
MKVHDERESAFLSGKTALQSAMYSGLGSHADSVLNTSQAPCPGCFPLRVAQKTPSRQEGLQAGLHRTGRQYHPPGWLACGTAEVESAYYGQSLLASGLRQARGTEVIKRRAPAMNARSLLASGLKAL